MRHARDWWAAIPEAERVWLVEAERLADRCGGGGGYNMPDGYGDCPMCSSPSSSGLCNLCLEHHAYIIAEADAAFARPLRYNEFASKRRSRKENHD